MKCREFQVNIYNGKFALPMDQRKYFRGDDMNSAECFFGQLATQESKFFLHLSLYCAIRRVCCFDQRENVRELFRSVTASVTSGFFSS